MSSLRNWLLATRPKTLPAAVIPVALGSAMAYADGGFHAISALVALVCALLIQISTNFINEVYDFRSGADSVDRVGPTRAVAAGNISERAMIIASWIVVLICFVCGLYLVDRAGWEILIVGLVSLFFAWAYTGGPYPLAYKGLGDIFVFLFFGLVATCGTYYVQAHTLHIHVLFLALVPGALSTAILEVNNIRDIETDARVQKRTLAVRLGRNKAVLLYYGLLAMAYSVPPHLFFWRYSAWSLLPMLTLPLALKLMINVRTKTGPELNAVLAGTAGLLVVFGVLAILGFVLN